ncbi:MAG: nitrilase-related carbon-nitrogen hydrolase [Candidatus Nanopelagicales bacterium]|nr:nitrilase-related carbon-nitrogen hydrolase [Candidatus Nanopelagicales bacterium]
MTDTASAPELAPLVAASPKFRRRTWLGIGLAAISAVMLFLTWDGNGGLWPLILIAFVPMYVAQYRLLSPRMSGLAVAIAAFGNFFALGRAVSGILGGIAGIGAAALIALILSSVWWFLAAFDRRYSERTNYRWFLIQLPLLWVGVEVLLGSNLLTATNYWIAYRLAYVPDLVQPISVVSTPVLGFLLMVINAAIALAVLRWFDRRWPALATVPIPRRTVAWSAGIAGGLAVLWVASSLLINAQVNSQLGPAVRVAALQPDPAKVGTREAALKAKAGDPAEEIARMAMARTQMEEMTREAAAKGAVLVVWPEILFHYDVTAAQGQWIADLARQTKTTLVVGFEPDYPELRASNLAAVFGPDGSVQGQVYHKVHPVIAMAEGFNTDPVYEPYQTPFGQLGVIICFDYDFPQSSPRETVKNGAQIVATPSLDDASFGPLRWQTLTFRAIENRVPFVKSAKGFDSAIINANGQAMWKEEVTDPAGQKVVLVADVNLGPRNAPFTQIGMYWVTAALLIGLILRFGDQYLLARRQRRTERAQAATPDAEQAAD